MTWRRQERDQRMLGTWSFERRDDEIADLRFGGRRVLRSIRPVVRDGDWNTVPLVVDSVAADGTATELAVRSEVFAGTLRIELDDAALLVTLDLVAARDVDTNRTGLIVLHPPQLAGHDLAVGHPDGTTETTRLTAEISAHQPVFDIASLGWTDDGVQVHVEFTGDVFEMEDQRNWTDASFKTYSRPLSLPFPYRVAAGEHVVQSLRISAVPVEADVAADAPAETAITLHPAGRFPSIGVAASSAPDPAPVVESLGSSLLVEADLAGVDWRAALERAVSSGLPLDVRFVLDPAAPEKVAEAVAALDGVEVVRASAFHQVGGARHVSDVEAIDLLRRALADHGRSLPVIGGSRSHFTELNRELHRLPADLDGLAVTVTPLFHSADTEQLVESVAMQRLVAQETVARAAGRPVHIGPIALRPRFNDVAAAPQPLSPHPDLRDGYGPEFTGMDDGRQSAPELAAWTVASAAALAVPGVDSIAWFEEWGPRGIRDADGTPLPVADALRQLAALADIDDAVLLTGPSPDGLVWAIGARSDSHDDVLLANIDEAPRSVTLVTPAGRATVSLAADSVTRIRLTTPPEEQTP
ncbi:hypothetical protein SRABI76_02290 [Microbacterium oxydans]|uniref:hypothetical protein n=1 Tax=Microbacterium oxydans TaxID=82380 RepID=UPI001DF874DB|nr:hypothetical protein [Microbacterium oxydans]CAH0212072.1 hypothetical protein SRABI76_02290 [Microbacterium oxydans]